MTLFTRRTFLTSAFGLTGMAGAGGAYTGYIEPALTLKVTHYAPKLPKWPKGQKLTITLIADPHAGGPNMGLERINQVVEVANAQKSDLIMLMGDYVATHKFVTEKVDYRDWSAAYARLRATYGVYAILGNHDWWHGVGAIRQALLNAKIPVLENQVKRIQSLNPFWIAGLGDQLAYPLGHDPKHHAKYLGVDDLPGTLAQITDDAPVLLMAHEPDIFVQVPERVAITFAGHTHGGQVRIPYLWPSLVPSAYGARFAYGHIIEEDRHMIVSGGLGTAIAPVRMGVPPELVVVTLGT
jgi:uncharacterized protein